MDKEYVAEVVLGVQTDTYDREGQITDERDVSHLTRAQIEKALKLFVGDLEQMPPPFSAVSSGGKRHYELARAGKEVPLRPRAVRVESIDLLELLPATEMPAVALWLGPKCPGKLVVRMQVVCGAGTYVRSIASDFGSALGTRGALGSLVRTRVGKFMRRDAIALAALGDGHLPELKKPEVVLAALPPVALHSLQLAVLRQGRQLPLAEGFSSERMNTPTWRHRFLVRVHDLAGTLAGIGEVVSGGSLRPVRMMPWSPRELKNG
jgi:tRNA pseudouridine55 synthase